MHEEDYREIIEIIERYLQTEEFEFAENVLEFLKKEYNNLEKLGVFEEEQKIKPLIDAITKEEPHPNRHRAVDELVKLLDNEEKKV